MGDHFWESFSQYLHDPLKFKKKNKSFAPPQNAGNGLCPSLQILKIVLTNPDKTRTNLGIFKNKLVSIPNTYFKGNMYQKHKLSLKDVVFHG